MSTAPTAAPGRTTIRTLLAITLGIPTVIALMLLAFAAPALNSGAHDLPLAVSGPAPAAAKVAGLLDAKAPGTFDITTYGTEQEAADAIRHQKAVGGLAVAPTGVAVQTAAGAGAPYAALLKGMGAQLAAGGQKVTYSELAPLSADDPAGVGLATLGLPLVFGGMASGAALTLAQRGSRWSRVGGVVAVSTLGGLVAAAILQCGFHAFDGNFWLVAAAVVAGIAAISATVTGLGALLGMPGVALAAVLMLFVSNPISGLAAGPAWLPRPWGEIGQFLPVGAAGTAMRSAAYFDGLGAERAWIVLAAWFVVGAALALLARGRHTGAATTVTA